MALDLVHLDDPGVRELMLEEVEADIRAGTLYMGKRLSDIGMAAYPELLREAVRSGNDTSLAVALRSPGLHLTHERRERNGKVIIASVPVTAAETLAEGEFGRFYLRALCRHALVQGITALVVYRAKEVTAPRSTSVAMLGSLIMAAALLEDLRQHGVDTALGLPPGPNSGLSARLPEASAANQPLTQAAYG